MHLLPVRVLAPVLAGVLMLSAGPLSALETDAPADLAAGIRQVEAGDFEGAVLTLDAVVRTLSTQPDRAPELARAHLQLGIAQVALGQDTAARTNFKEALRREPTLRLGADRNSPKVIAAFEAARAELRREPQGGAKHHTSPTVVALVGGVAATVAIVLVKVGGGNDAETGTASLSGARFSTPVIECPNGSDNAPIPLSLSFEASNPTKSPLAFDNIATVLVIASSALPAEVGLASSRPTSAVPATIAAGQTATVRLDTTLLCDNDAGDPIRFNEWSGRITLSSSGRVFNLDAADRLRVNIP